VQPVIWEKQCRKPVRNMGKIAEFCCRSEKKDRRMTREGKSSTGGGGRGRETAPRKELQMAPENKIPVVEGRGGEGGKPLG